MNAIEMLKKQHREVAKLFERFGQARSAEGRQQLFEQIADKLAIHAAIEERHFYPSVKNKATDDLLLESVEEHLEMKRIIADLLRLEGDDENYVAKVKVLQEDVEHHVGEEESELFPKVAESIDEEILEAIAEDMAETQSELLDEGDPREAIPEETDEAAPV